MPVDSSQLLYLCPVCEKPFRQKERAVQHIRDTPTGGHSGISSDEAERRVEIREPQIRLPESFGHTDIEEAREVVRSAIQNRSEDGVRVRYKELASRLDLPPAFTARELKYEHDLVPAHDNGTEASRINYRWDDLTQNQKDTLLAWAYYPDYSQSEIADLHLSGHGLQSSVSQVVRLYGWMLAHPEVDTPIQPTEEENGTGEVQLAGDPDPDEWIENLESLKGGKPQTEQAGEVAQTADENDGEPEKADEPDLPGATPGVDTEKTTEQAPEVAGGSGSVSVDGELAILESELAFEAIASMIETGRYEEARELFKRATGEEEYDLRWSADE